MTGEPVEQSDTPVGAAVPVDLDAVAADLAAVEDALARLDDGTYGTCVGCGGPIDDARLAADPTTRTCATHAA